MNTSTAFNPPAIDTPFDNFNIYNIQSFDPTPKQIEISADAVEIAKQMRGDGETEVEDLARALIIIRGAGLYERFQERNCISDPIEDDRQVVAYMDAVSILIARHPDPHVLNR